jgi:uncharacterized membrane protein YfcA
MSDQGLILLATLAAIFVSSVAGYGGSLILVPALAAILGPKAGIAFSALVLGWNNVFKVLAYRRTLALRQGRPLLVVTAIGAWFGASLLIDAPDRAVIWTVVGVTMVSLLVELVGSDRILRVRRSAAVPAMGSAAVLSGISGTSGPLKGIAVRNLGLPRLEHVGLASAISLVGDALKVELFRAEGLLDGIELGTLFVALPIMPLGAWAGRVVNERVDERVFQYVFWAVVGCYTLRMVGFWF